MNLCPDCGFTLDGPLHRDYCPSRVAWIANWQAHRRPVIEALRRRFADATVTLR